MLPAAGVDLAEAGVKTGASRGDPDGLFEIGYRLDLLAACLFGLSQLVPGGAILRIARDGGTEMAGGLGIATGVVVHRAQLNLRFVEGRVNLTGQAEPEDSQVQSAAAAPLIDPIRLGLDH